MEKTEARDSGAIEERHEEPIPFPIILLASILLMPYFLLVLAFYAGSDLGCCSPSMPCAWHVRED
jgi:hypothetical protein